MNPITTEHAAAWMDGYGRAWVERNPVFAVSLFSATATYSQTPFGPHYRGHQQIAAYWSDITEHERDIDYISGQPLVSGRWAFCEWWVTMTEHGDATTLPGCLVVKFDNDGRCQELREYWHQEAGHHTPFRGWGNVSES